MKKLKNNKGVTGIDIVVSVTLIVITLGVVMALYTSYANKTKEVERTSTATNLAMTVIEYIETIKDIDNTNISNITNEGIVINSGNYGLPADVSQGYTITAKRINSGEDLLQNIAFQIDVTVSYNVGNEAKEVTLSTIKKYNEVGEAEEPDMESSTIDGCIPVKYDSAKNGYVKTDENDSEWYSISSKVFPIVIKPQNGKDFNRNGVIQLEDCDKIYVWMPSYGTTGSATNLKYRFCNEEGKIIKYTVDSTTKIATYKIDDLNSVNDRVIGTWIEVNDNLEAKSSNTNYDNLRNKIFTW